MSDEHSIYYGNSFNVDNAGAEWSIWRISGNDGSEERLILTLDAMDELATYFREYYADDRKYHATSSPGDS